MATTFLIFCSTVIHVHTVNSQTYPFKTWMSDWSGSDASTYYPPGVTIESSTIFDLVLPGANQAGMSFSTSDTTASPSNPILDVYGNTLNTLDTNAEKQLWAARQKGSVFDLLMSGVRFLDLKFQHIDGTTEFYSYNGLLGRNISEIIADINNFLTNIGTSEIILIYLHDTIFSNSDTFANEHLRKEQLMDKFVNNAGIYSKMARSNVHIINDRTIRQLLDAGVQIIIFSDDPNPSNAYANADYFYDANVYLFNPTGNGQGGNSTNSNSTSITYGQLDESKELRSFVINNIRYGWPDNRLNLIYWTLDIGSSFTEQFVYNSMQHFSSSAHAELNRVLYSYEKLWFANVIIVDFVEVSDIMEQILILNYKYLNCRDAIWGNNATGCPYLTQLNSKYLTSDISPFCTIDTDLQTNAFCPRSCGVCPNVLSIAGNPGHSCDANTDCNSVLYDFYDQTGTCFIRGIDERSEQNIAQDSFCLSLNAQPSCANKEVNDKCSDDSSGVDQVDLSLCSQYCSANWQCADGYCNTEYSVCMTLLESSTTTAEPVSSQSDQKYDFLESEGAEIMLRDVAPFRPGDYQAPPDFSAEGCDNSGGPGPDMLLCGMDANPYLASLLGFALIPFIMASLLCFCYTFCCCPCWCCCDQCGKKCCCCHKIMKDPIANKDKCRQWTPFAFLAAALVIVVWACIEGIVNNGEMHDHIFAEDNSVRYAINHLFNEVIDRFEAVEPTAEFIIDQGQEIINEVFEILETNVDSIGGVMDNLYAALSQVESNYSKGVNISATFQNPFSINGSLPNESFTLDCPYCNSIADNAATMKDQLNSSIGSQLGQIDGFMNQTKQLVNAKDRIKNLTEVFFETLNEVINTSHTIQTTANDYIDLGAKYDKKYRQQPAQIFFAIPMGLLIFAIAGIFMRNKWCFKCEWCCAMYCCGIPIMLLSWPFIFFAVLWGDICVRLDDFEQNLGQSQIGILAGMDNITDPNDPRAMGMALVNTCWHGGSPLELFNLTQNLNWDMLRDEMDKVLDIDITGMLENTDFGQFSGEIDTLSVDEFIGEVDGFIANANNVGEYCGCGAAGIPFTRANLYTPPKFDYCAQYTPPNNSWPNIPTLPVIPTGWPVTTASGGGIFNGMQFTTFYWYNTTMRDGGKCQSAFVNASAAVQIQTQMKDVATAKIGGIKNVYSNGVFDTYDDLFEIALNLEGDVSSISCLIEPLFDQFDVIIDNFTNCGFLGEAYGNFKEAGCINLFDDWYKIARALALIAYISIVIVFMSLCMDYIHGPVTKRSVTDIEAVHDPNDSEVIMEYLPEHHTNNSTVTGGVELVTPQQNTRPYGYDDAAPSVASDRYRTQSVASYSGNSSKPPATVVVVSSMGMYGTQNRPVMADSVISEAQQYSVGYDNEPVNRLEPIAQGVEQPREGGINETGNDNYDEPVVPQVEPNPGFQPPPPNGPAPNENNAAVIDDDIDIVLQDSSDEVYDEV